MNDNPPNQSVRDTSPPVFRSALLSLAILWLAFPPIGWAWLAWFAPFPMLRLIFLRDLGRRGYRKLYLAGLLYWMATFYFIPIPHPLLWGCWLAVSLYMACYTPLLIGVARTMILRFQVPALAAIPIAWTGLEYFRCHFATGMPMVCLSHSQYRSPILIQIADLSGSYTVTFAMILFAAGLTLLLRPWLQFGDGQDGDIPPKFPIGTNQWAGGFGIVIAIGFTIGYGYYRLPQFEVESPDASRPNIEVALIQTNRDVIFSQALDEELLNERIDEVVSLTHSEVLEKSNCDLVVWPESSLSPYPDYLSDGKSFTAAESQARLREYYYAAMSSASAFKPVPLLAGTVTRDPEKETAYNSAVLLDQGKVTDRYYKRHLVMFGEYVPLADQIPLVKMLSPMQRNLDMGVEPIAIEVKDIVLTPSICFESTVPHVVRSQILWHQERGVEIDAMVNITNDGWFFGTSCLDLHLACNVFRAVEMRKQHLVCANTGISANIAPTGVLLAEGGRRTAETLRCRVAKSVGQKSVYRQYGDLLPMIFQYCVGVFLILGWYLGRAEKANATSAKN